MYRAQKCVCCQSENIEKFPGLMAQFLIDRMTGATNPPSDKMCSTVHCLDCDYVGSELRFSSVEENRYYQNYGVGEYVRHREKYEPGITTTFYNLQMDEIKKHRKEVTFDILKNTMDLSTISSLLDYGGNTGEMIPDEFSNIDRYVTDVQNRVLRNGVKSVTGPEESGKVDLILCSHTMEHVSHPYDMTVDLKRYLKPNGWLYLEVPNELPVPKEGELWHEHINKFTMECLVKHMESHGFEVKFCATDKHGHTHIPLSHVIVGQLTKKEDRMFVDYCVNCGNKDVKKFDGDVHAFVLDRMEGKPKNPNGPRLTKCGSIYCPECEYTGSAIRFNQEEEKRFYSEYGEKSYVTQRCQYEGQHMEYIFNTYNEPRYIQSRRETLSEFLNTFINVSQITSILDFGGGNGQLIPEDLSHTSRYVLDFSNKVPKVGVTAVKDVSECPPVDLLISAHTLEHVSFPEEFLEHMKTFIRPGGLIYIEIPNEHNSNNEHKYHDWHEHIQNFSFKSLYTLLANHGITVIGEGTINLITGDTALAVLGQLE